MQRWQSPVTHLKRARQKPTADADLSPPTIAAPGDVMADASRSCLMKKLIAPHTQPLTGCARAATPSFVHHTCQLCR